MNQLHHPAQKRLSMNSSPKKRVLRTLVIAALGSETPETCALRTHCCSCRLSAEDGAAKLCSRAGAGASLVPPCSPAQEQQWSPLQLRVLLLRSRGCRAGDEASSPIQLGCAWAVQCKAGVGRAPCSTAEKQRLQLNKPSMIKNVSLALTISMHLSKGLSLRR